MNSIGQQIEEEVLREIFNYESKNGHKPKFIITSSEFLIFASNQNSISTLIGSKIKKDRCVFNGIPIILTDDLPKNIKFLLS